MGAVITLTTDFGLNDGYVAAMKGVILGINPSAQIIDVCHTIQPQNINQAAFILGTVYSFFPSKTVHLAVVDPEVGSERRAIILKTNQAYFIAPDNGVLSYIIQQYSSRIIDKKCNTIEPGTDIEAFAITNPKFWLSPVSSTFHGRDIFAPVAAHLSLGHLPEEFGSKIKSISVLPIPHPYQSQDNSLIGRILHIDNFGNLITNIRETDLPINKTININIADHTITGLSSTYREGEKLLALIGSNGHLEIACSKGSAATLICAKIGGEVIIRY